MYLLDVAAFRVGSNNPKGQITVKNGVCLIAVPTIKDQAPKISNGLFSALKDRILAADITQKLQSSYHENNDSRASVDCSVNFSFDSTKGSPGFLHHVVDNKEALTPDDLARSIRKAFGKGVLQALFTSEELSELGRKTRYFTVYAIPIDSHFDGSGLSLVHQIDGLNVCFKASRDEIKLAGDRKQQKLKLFHIAKDFLSYDYFMVMGSKREEVKVSDINFAASASCLESSLGSQNTGVGARSLKDVTNTSSDSSLSTLSKPLSNIEAILRRVSFLNQRPPAYESLQGKTERWQPAALVRSLKK